MLDALWEHLTKIVTASLALALAAIFQFIQWREKNRPTQDEDDPAIMKRLEEIERAHRERVANFRDDLREMFEEHEKEIRHQFERLADKIDRR